jgi:hypothetical protein
VPAFAEITSTAGVGGPPAFGPRRDKTVLGHDDKPLVVVVLVRTELAAADCTSGGMMTTRTVLSPRLSCALRNAAAGGCSEAREQSLTTEPRTERRST